MADKKVWQAVVDVPPSLQRVVEFLLRVVDIGADFLGALGANAPREKLQWVRRAQKNLDHKLNFSGIM